MTPKNRWNQSQIQIWNVVIDGDTIYNYRTSDGMVYVTRWNKFVYLHYIMAYENKKMTLHYWFSHSKEYVDIKHENDPSMESQSLTG